MRKVSERTIRRIENGELVIYNAGALEKLKKYVLVAVATVTLAGGITGYALGTKVESMKLPGTIPAGCVLTYIEDSIDYGGNVTDTARDYYNEAYDDMYHGLNTYAKVVEEINGLYHNETVHVGDTIKLPVIVDETNPHYIQMLVLQNQIRAIEQNNYWVSYTVQLGDNISVLASKASGSHAETALLTNKIIEKNHLGGILQAGTTIWIVNPELGPLKLSLQEETKQLQEELKGDDQDTNQDTNQDVKNR